MKRFCSVFKNVDENAKLTSDGLRLKTEWISILVLCFCHFLGTLQAGAFRTVTWPYLHQIDPGASDHYAGFIQSAQAGGNAIAALISGYVCNKMNQAKHSMILSKCVTTIAAILYITIELYPQNRRYAFLVYEFVLGIGIGCLLIGRTHVAMASTEEDRQHAVAVQSLAISLGFTLGPLIELAFTNINYPGPNFGNVHINLYTLPAYLAMLICIMSVVILGLCFHGRLRPNGLATTYTMTIFGWSSKEATFYKSLSDGIIGFIAAVVNVLYIVLKISKLISERLMILISLSFYFIFFIVTFPWPSYGSSIPYQHPENLSESVTNDTITMSQGCNINYEWCSYTPPINVWLYYVMLVVFIGSGTPLINVNLDILFSKILGPIRQGTMHGVFLAVGDCINVFGPIVVSSVYVASGPRWIWLATMIIIFTGFFVFLICFRRMVPYYSRSENQHVQSHIVNKS